ncbi:hypothetical protein LWC35_00730 [Pseudonocardia kujensis]|uniref:hypothetical protein n=1 Tax=Pseudonocardia kujensis TaxID=1128675 RepID=UPI001E30D7E8|nr:hypothetical protein [Pseudonocardia kujensis]MCE0761447.1 hypothetical protein [Pseudonocardia kujensis]
MAVRAVRISPTSLPVLAITPCSTEGSAVALGLLAHPGFTDEGRDRPLAASRPTARRLECISWLADGGCR